MSAYTVSQLAHNAGVSVHIVRDYLVRGLLRPVACTTGGYGVFDDAALQRLCFVRAAFEAGIGLDALARLCRAPAGFFLSRVPLPRPHSTPRRRNISAMIFRRVYEAPAAFRSASTL
ncbi:mercuric resistance operon coregulator [Klebsiella pneumoniae]|nr:mercuric resistance operon coregulator [Klebsiella pneumoniae]